MSDASISHLRYTPASRTDEHTGLLGFVSCRYGSLVLDGITVRRGSDGRTLLSWPGRRDKQGQLHHSVRPADDDARVALEAAVFDALDLPGEVRP